MDVESPFNQFLFNVRPTPEGGYFSGRIQSLMAVLQIIYRGTNRLTYYKSCRKITNCIGNAATLCYKLSQMRHAAKTSQEREKDWRTYAPLDIANFHFQSDLQWITPLFCYVRHAIGQILYQMDHTMI